jgi:acetyl esterase/lipase
MHRHPSQDKTMQDNQLIPLGLLVVLLAQVVLTTPGSAAEIIFTPGIEFSHPANQHLQLDLAMPTNATRPLPAILCIHGGGFRAGTRDNYDDLCRTLAAHGYVAVTITYRLAPAFPFPAAVFDCKAAVRWLRANAALYHIDPARIGVTGASAGGHLAQFLGVTKGVAEFEGEGNLDQSSAVSCVVNYYGPSDLTRSYGHSVDAAQVLPLFFGGDLTTKRHEHIIGSPLYWITPSAAPTLCVHGTADKYVAYEQATWTIDKLKACDVEAELLTLPGAGHGFRGANAHIAENALIAFFDAHLHPDK